MTTPDELSSFAALSSSNRSLVRLLRKGNQDAATRLFFRYASRLRQATEQRLSKNLKRHVDADDIVQSVFRSVFRGLITGQYEVPAGNVLWKLLLVIALNKLRSTGEFYCRLKRDMRRTGSMPAGDSLSPIEREGDHVAMLSLKVVINETLDCMPDNQKEMVMLRIEGHEVADIAQHTRRSKRSVERVLQEFREKLARISHQCSCALAPELA